MMVSEITKNRIGVSNNIYKITHKRKRYSNQSLIVFFDYFGDKQNIEEIEFIKNTETEQVYKLID